MPPRSDHSDRGKRDRIERLRKRLERAVAYGSDKELANVIKGVLDLIADEL